MKLIITAIPALLLCCALADEDAARSRPATPEASKPFVSSESAEARAARIGAFREQFLADSRRRQQEVKLERTDPEVADSARRYRSVKSEYEDARDRFLLPITHLREQRDQVKEQLLQADDEYQRRVTALNAAKEQGQQAGKIAAMIDAHRRTLVAKGHKGYLNNHEIHLLLLKSQKADEYRELLSESRERQKEIRSLQHAVGARKVELTSSSKELPALWDRIMALRYSLSRKMDADARIQSLKTRMEKEKRRHDALVATKLNSSGNE